MRFIDLYCGAGFGARGAVAAGATPILAIDSWDVATDAYSLNFPDAEIIQSRLEDLDPADYSHIGQVDLLLCSPECTAHSIARGARKGSKASQDGAFVLLDWVAEFSPDWIIIENVTRLKSWSRFSEFKDALAAKEYEVLQLVLNAADYGVAQSRKRLFLVGNRLGTKLQQAEFNGSVSSSPASTIIDVSERWTSGKLYVGRRAEETKNKAKRAIAALGRRKPFLIVYYGSDYAGGWQSVDAPLRTVTTLDRFGLVTWDGNTPLLRMLQPPELLDAMGASGHKLPETSRRNQVKLCGNGICSPVIEKIVRTISKVEEKSQSEQLGAIS